jgi:Bacteriophage HK97-gp10, putative tail-component
MAIRNSINLDRVRQFLFGRAAATVGEAAQFMAARARQYCPVDTGFMQSTITVVSSRGGATSSVLVTADYAQWVEFGHYSIAGTWVPPNPFMRNALADTIREFPTIATGTRMYRPQDARDPMNLGATFNS